MKKYLAIVASVLALSISSTTVKAAVVASDVTETGAAGDVYDNGWQTGDNGGTGFGPWTLNASTTNTSNAGFFIGSATANGTGGSGGAIDTLSESWATYANSGANTSAVRPLTGGPLQPSQTFLINMDNGNIDTGSEVGVVFQTAGGADVAKFSFTGGASNYAFNGSTSTFGFTADGVRLSIKYNANNTYTFSAVRISSGTTYTSTFARTVDIGQVLVFNRNAGSGGTNNAYFNGLAVIPEPTSLGCLAGVGLMALRRRK